VASHYEELKWLFAELLNECLRARNTSIVSEFLGLVNDAEREDLTQFLFWGALLARDWWLAEDCLALGVSMSPQEGYSDGPLHVAMCYYGDSPDVIGWMLDHGAEIERRDWAKANETPLIYATALGLIGVVELLLQRGADPNASTITDNDDTALILATKRGDKRLVELLLAHGAQVDWKNRWQQDAATLAQTAGHEDVSRLIVIAGRLKGPHNGTRQIAKE
jgi:hypothetical protein